MVGAVVLVTGMVIYNYSAWRKMLSEQAAKKAAKAGAAAAKAASAAAARMARALARESEPGAGGGRLESLASVGGDALTSTDDPMLDSQGDVAGTMPMPVPYRPRP